MFANHQFVLRFCRKPNFQLDTIIYKSSLLIASARALLTRRKCKYASRNVLYSISMSKLKNSKKYNRPNIETLQPPSASDTGHGGKPRYQQLDNNRQGLPSIQTKTSVTLSSCTRLLVWKITSEQIGNIDSENLKSSREETSCAKHNIENNFAETFLAESLQFQSQTIFLFHYQFYNK